MGKRFFVVMSPARLILFSFLILICLGTLLLALPASRTQPISLIDLLFTATSATCVTGTFTIPLTSFTLFGKAIILTLIQIGALGLATMSLFILSLFVELGIGTKLIATHLLELESWKIKKILIFTFFSTIIAEIIGTISFFSLFKDEYPFHAALFHSLFHSISSFCNAGVSSIDQLTQQSLQPYSNSYLFLATSSLLMFLGSLGFITWHELMLYSRSLFSKKRYRFSLHSKIILYGTGALLLTSATIFWILEADNTIASLSFPLIPLNTLFHAISFKSCGFITTDLHNYHSATLFFMLLIGLIGSAPLSTGSGIKISTFAVFISTIKAAISGRSWVEMMGRQIPLDQVYKAMAIISISIGWIFFTTFCLLITEPNWSFMDLFFETTSAFSNVGFSLGETEQLSFIGKVFIMTTMLIGRIGSLTLILGLKLKTKKETVEFSYPEERVILG